MMKNEMLASMDEEHVLGVVIESCLHDPITDQDAQNEDHNPYRPGPVFFRHP